MKKQHIYLILIGVMAVWGLNVIATKILVANMMPVTMTAFRIFTAGVSLFILLFLFKQVRRISRKEFAYVIFAGLFNVVGHHYFLSVGLKHTTAANGGILLGMGPLLTAILAVLFLGNSMTWVRFLGIVLGFSGVSLIVLEGGDGIHGISIGDLYVFLAVMCQAISFVLIKKGSKMLDPRLMTGYMLITGAILLFIISRFVEPDGLSSMAHHAIGLWALFFASAIIATALGHMLYNFALAQVGATEASIFINLSPFFTLVGGLIFLDERIELAQLAGFAFIVVGVLLGSGAIDDFARRRSAIRRAAGIEDGL
jgi:drug/metabolite transporter (DMT)-like permease